MSSNYGVTPAGFVPKRMDTIYKEEHRDLSDAWGVNTMEDPESLLNVILTGQADRLAALWELGQEIYHNLYPSSAEGVSLDNAVQFAGLRRIADQKTFYSVLCTGDDGSAIPAGTTISSITQPPILFLCSADGDHPSVLQQGKNQDYLAGRKRRLHHRSKRGFVQRQQYRRSRTNRPSCRRWPIKSRRRNTG